MTLWHPEATRIPYPDAGPFVKAAPKLVWHTTETKGLPTYAGSAPHFTFNPQTGKLWQHIALNRSAKSLEHPSGTVETNHAHCIQVEMIGYAKETQDWSKADYARIAKLARWIETNASIPSACRVKFTGQATAPTRLSSAGWLAYAGHLGHQHVPSNHHWDPGAFRIDLVLAPQASESDEARRQRIWRRGKRQTDIQISRAAARLKHLQERAAKLAQLLGR